MWGPSSRAWPAIPAVPGIDDVVHQDVRLAHFAGHGLHAFVPLAAPDTFRVFFHIPMQAEIFHMFSKMGAYYFARR